MNWLKAEEKCSLNKMKLILGNKLTRTWLQTRVKPWVFTCIAWELVNIDLLEAQNYNLWDEKLAQHMKYKTYELA
jgi:hypothetical protein